MGIESAIITTFFINLAVAATITAISYVIRPRPDLRQRNRESSITIREPDSPRRIVYGETRVGTIMGDVFTNENNNYMLLPALLCEGEIESVIDIYFNDERMDEFPRGFVHGRRRGFSNESWRHSEGFAAAYAWVHFGKPDQTMWTAFDPATPSRGEFNDQLVGNFYADEHIEGRVKDGNLLDLAEQYGYRDQTLIAEGRQVSFDPALTSNTMLVTNYIPKINEDGLFRFLWLETAYANGDMPIADYRRLYGAFRDGVRIDTTEGDLNFAGNLEDNNAFFYPQGDGSESDPYRGDPVPYPTIYNFISTENAVDYSTEFVDEFQTYRPPRIIYHYQHQRFYIYDSASRQYLHWKYVSGGVDALDQSWYETYEVGRIGDIYKKRFTDIGLGQGYDPDRPYLRGIAYLGLEFFHDYEIFQRGLPNVSAIIRGRKSIYNPVTGETGWSDNPVLCLLDYMHDPKFGLGVAYDKFDTAPDGNIDAAIKACDELITTKNSRQVKRYRLNGIIYTNDSHATNIQRMLDTMAGTMNFVDGKWQIYPGVYRAARDSTDFTITEDLIVGTVNRKLALARRDSANNIKGTFIDRNGDYQPVSYTTQEDDSGVVRDKQIVSQTIDFPLVTDHEQATRLARIQLEEAKYSQTLSLRLSAEAFELTAGDIVRVDLPRLGIVGKEFGVARTTLNFGASGEFSIGVDLREYSEAIYAWDPATDETPPPATTSGQTTPEPEPLDAEPVVEDNMVSLCSTCSVRSRGGKVEGAEQPRTTTGGAAIDGTQWLSPIEPDGTARDHEPEERIEERNTTCTTCSTCSQP